jgi:hypothetical protein
VLCILNQEKSVCGDVMRFLRFSLSGVVCCLLLWGAPIFSQETYDQYNEALLETYLSQADEEQSREDWQLMAQFGLDAVTADWESALSGLITGPCRSWRPLKPRSRSRHPGGGGPSATWTGSSRAIQNSLSADSEIDTASGNRDGPNLLGLHISEGLTKATESWTIPQATRSSWTTQDFFDLYQDNPDGSQDPPGGGGGHPLASGGPGGHRRNPGRLAARAIWAGAADPQPTAWRLQQQQELREQVWHRKRGLFL